MCSASDFNRSGKVSDEHEAEKFMTEEKTDGNPQSVT